MRPRLGRRQSTTASTSLRREHSSSTTLPKTIGRDLVGTKDLIGPDFFAVVDATKGSPTYGQVVNTATVGPLVENEPHHMQYIWHKGDNLFAGGLFTDITYVFDISQLPKLVAQGRQPADRHAVRLGARRLLGHQGPQGLRHLHGRARRARPVRLQRRLGAARQRLRRLARLELVRLDANGKTLWEAPADARGRRDRAALRQHPAAAAADLRQPARRPGARGPRHPRSASDYNEPRNIILNPVQAPSSYLRRPTVRTWDISNPDKPRLRAVSFLPDGPRVGKVPHHEEPRAAMETTVTNLPDHKGAFASTMQGGAIYYTPDITAAKPEWREVFDLTTSNKAVDPASTIYGGGSNAGWTQTSLDDKYLYVAVVGRGASGDDKGSPPYILKLDISKLVASGTTPSCVIDSEAEITQGGQEADCPTIHDTLPAPGGPHWGALDNLELGEDGYYHETTDVEPDRVLELLRRAHRPER